MRGESEQNLLAGRNGSEYGSTVLDLYGSGTIFHQGFGSGRGEQMRLEGVFIG